MLSIFPPYKIENAITKQASAGFKISSLFKRRLHMKYFLTIVFCILLPFINILYAAELTGTVSDTVDTPLKDVKLKLECLSGDPFLDSTYTDSTGRYSFTGFPMGSYRISLRKDVYVPKDSLFVLGSSDYVINFVLVDSVSGTYHSGEESGVWLPSGNTHWIVGDVTVTDSLYIAPGCSVVFLESNKISLNASLHIGSINGSITDIAYGRIMCDDENVNVYIENAICSSDVYIKCNVFIVNNSNLRRIEISKSNNLTINNSTFDFKVFKIDSSKNVYIRKTILPKSDNTQIRIIGDKVVLDSVQLKAGLDSPQSLLTGIDSLIIINSTINGYCYLMQGNYFNTSLTLNGGNILINYCTSKTLNLELFQHSSIKIEHSNIQKFIPFEIKIDQDSIINNIIDSLNLYNLPDSIYKSPFFYNIITYLDKWDSHFVGLTENIQVNSNGDSCDLWFNMKTDPLFADDTKTILFNTSPAIKAASDGTNIGYYQGTGVGILIDNNQTNPASIILIIKKSSILFNLPKSGNTKLQIYNMKGRLLSTLVDSYKQAGEYKVNWDSKRFGSGVYFLKLCANGSAVSKKFTVVR